MMKKLFPFLLSVLFSNLIYSQNELALFEVWEGEVFKKSSTEFFCVISKDFFVFDEDIVKTGQHSTFLSANYQFIEGVFSGMDSSVIISIISGPGTLFTSLIKYDKNWNEVMNIYISSPGHFGGELSNGNIIFGSSWGNEITAVDPNDGEIWNVGTGLETKDIHVTEGDSIISISNDGLFIFSANGDTIAIFPSFDFSHLVPIKNVGWAGQKADSLFLLSPNFDLLEIIVFPNVEVLDMEADYGNVVLLTKDSTVHIYDQSLVFENSFKISSNNFSQPKNFELAEDGLIVSNGGAFKKYLWDSTDLYSDINDIGIVDVQLGDYIIEDYVVNWAQGAYDTIVRLRYTDPIFTVHNYGETSIESFDISTSFPILFVGGFNYIENFNGFIRRYIFNVSIAPGEEKEVVWNNLGFYFRNPPNGEIYDQCFWTTRPNLRIDDNYTNDKHCFEMAVATDEEFKKNTAVFVFPNPSNGTFKISVSELKSTNATWVLYDQFGRQQFIEPINKWQGEYAINLQHLPTGVYFWKMEISDGILNSGRLVIQR